MRTPVFSISAGGTDITGNLAGLNMTMTITDGEGLKSDTLEITIDDVNGMIEAPRTGVTLSATGGYAESGVRDFGLFTVDQVTFEGWPQKITISASSVAAKSLAKEAEPKAYPTKDYATYGDIFSEIAGKIGLGLQMAGELMGIANPYEAQSEEGGLEFVSKLGEKLNASVSVKSNNLVVTVKGSGQSASGGALQQVIVAPGINLLSYSVTQKDEPKHSEVESTYYDRAANERKTVTESTGMEGPKFLMRHPYQEEGEAQRAAQSKAKDLTRAQAEATFVIEGDPFAQVEAHAMVSGCRPGVDGEWRVKTVTHTFSADAAYTTSLQCDVPA
jgi:phage protein D